MTNGPCQFTATLFCSYITATAKTQGDAWQWKVKAYMNILDLLGSDRQTMLPEVHGAIPLGAPGH